MSPACRPLWSSESICSTAVPNRSAKAMLAVFLTVKSLSQSASDRSKRLISSALKRPAASVATRRILESEFSLAPATTDAARGDDLTSHAGAGSALFNALVRRRSASSSVKPSCSPNGRSRSTAPAAGAKGALYSPCLKEADGLHHQSSGASRRMEEADRPRRHQSTTRER